MDSAMEILSVEEMYAADRATTEAGTPGLKLMESAGQAVVDAIVERWAKRPVLVLAGPGNNGGDGFVVARLLKAKKWPVTVYLLGDKAKLTGDALANAKRWRTKMQPLETALDALAGREAGDEVLVVDALFGAGLSKPLSGAAKTLAEMLNLMRDGTGEPSVSVVAVDMPSGVDGDTGQPLGGVAFRADVSVTFCRFKPGHVLMPGRALCGDLEVADIGIPDDVVDQVAPQVFVNTPELWLGAFPWPREDTNKYTRGHAVVLGGAGMPGAARLGAYAARRMGAGLASIAVTEESFATYAAAAEPGTIVTAYKGMKEFRKILADARKTTWLMGPGAGVGKATRDKVLAALKADKNAVLDADAVTSFQDHAKTLFKAVKGHDGEVVLTPHGGEFPRLFPDLAKKQTKLGKLTVTRMAAKRAGAVVLYKGPDTVIAAPDGRAAITVNAPATLATGGSGDTLAGFIAALLVQGMEGFEAACGAAWLHGECANAFGPGLIAEDLADELPGVLDGLLDDL